MLKLGTQLEKIEQQKKAYKILLIKSRYRKALEDHLWREAAELASMFDAYADGVSPDKQKQNGSGLLDAFQMIRIAPKTVLDFPLIMDAHACVLAYSNPTQGGIFRRMRARWLNSVMILSNWEKVPYLMGNLVDGINQKRIPAFYWEECPDIHFQHFARNPVMQAIESNYNTVAIHPFSDGNKRVARLISAWILDKYGYIPLSIYDREGYISGIENYFTTRRPHMLYDVMLDQMRKSYDNAINDAKGIETVRVMMPQIRPYKKGRTEVIL